MRRRRFSQARGLGLQTGGSSGRWPFTTFTMMCRMFFSSAKGRCTGQGSSVGLRQDFLSSGGVTTVGKCGARHHQPPRRHGISFSKHRAFFNPSPCRAHLSSVFQVLETICDLPNGITALYHRAGLFGHRTSKENQVQRRKTWNEIGSKGAHAHQREER